MAKSSFVQNPAKIKVIGMGGGGSNAITRMVRDEIRGVEFIAMNTDAQALAITEAPIRFQLGERLTRGLGAGDAVMVGLVGATQDIGIGCGQRRRKPLDPHEHVGVPARRRRCADRHGGGDADEKQVERQRAEQ